MENQESLKSSKEDRKRSIRSKIVNGYFAIVATICVLIVGSLSFLLIVERGYKDIVNYRGQQLTAQSVITSHYKWLNSLSDSILTDINFDGSLDPNTCSLGKWLNEDQMKKLSDPEMVAALDSIIEPHKEIHAAASGLLEQSKTDTDGAYAGYTTEIKPRVEKIGAGLTTVSNRYEAIAKQKADTMAQMVVVSFGVNIVLGLFAVGFSLIYARFISNKISTPLVTVAEWSEALATGIDNINLNSEFEYNGSDILEVERMTRAFTIMVDSIQQNVSVIKRIASGDMTVFVDIKSDGDVLGRNLYHLVQNNDMMFAQLLRVADSVAANAQNIADASQSQAEQTSNQAVAVEQLSTTISKANELASDNAGRARLAADVSDEIKKEVGQGDEKMKLLLKSVGEIKQASEKISTVMKSIDDIAFQTNILALNAAVEAARAGTAGKGFSVVAEEVRNLALKSADAAKQSSELIANTISKTKEGSRISEETFEMFEHIVNSTDRITNVVRDISSASDKQQQYIDTVHMEITKITQAVTGNAASSEETASATQEMTVNANVIHEAMKKFNLRKREEGKPYIPAEKANDEAFIKAAYENYQKASGSRQLR